MAILIRKILFFIFLAGIVCAFAADSGIIRGQFKYPDKKVPKDIEVCAQEIHTNKFYCTRNFTKIKSGWSYAGEIPVGDYVVLARSRKPKAKTGYYTMHVHCEGKDCKSHQRIVIHLFADQDLHDIDPNDWEFDKTKAGADVRLEVFKIKDFRFRSLCDREFYTGYVSLYQDQNEIFHENRCGHMLSFEPDKVQYDEKSYRVPVVKDITGTGAADLALVFYSGGAHCCWSHIILSLQNPVEILLKTKSFDQDNPLENPGGVWEANSMLQFVDLQKKGIYNITGRDETFDYWNGPYSATASYSPKTVFEFFGGKYDLAPDLMKKDAPSVDAFNDKINEVAEDFSSVSDDDLRAQNWDAVPVKLWGTMLHYLYTGHAELAWKFYDRVWSDDRPGKTEFLDAFKKQLENSPYWPVVKSMSPQEKPPDKQPG